MTIDGYTHIGMPRFQTVDDCLAAMTRWDIEGSVVCAFDSCPDLAMLHEAIRAHPGLFRAVGVPLGRDRSETVAGVRAQLAGGFTGIRLTGEDAAERPWLLEAIGRGHGIALVCGSDALAAAAPALLDHLARFDDALVVGGHFAGPTDPSALDRDAAVAELFRHERFAVVMSRQGHFPSRLIEDWADALAEVVGWRRLMWGSEAPVMYWRDDSIGNALAWFDRFRLAEDDRAALLSGTARRLVFDRPVAPAAETLELPFDPWAHEVRRSIPMWPFGLSADHDIAGPLVDGWMRWGGPDRGPLRDFLQKLVREGLEAQHA